MHDIAIRMQHRQRTGFRYMTTGELRRDSSPTTPTSVVTRYQSRPTKTTRHTKFALAQYRATIALIHLNLPYLVCISMLRYFFKKKTESGLTLQSWFTVRLLLGRLVAEQGAAARAGARRRR